MGVEIEKIAGALDDSTPIGRLPGRATHELRRVRQVRRLDWCIIPQCCSAALLLFTIANQLGGWVVREMARFASQLTMAYYRRKKSYASHRTGI